MATLGASSSPTSPGTGGTLTLTITGSSSTSQASNVSFAGAQIVVELSSQQYAEGLIYGTDAYGTSFYGPPASTYVGAQFRASSFPPEQITLEWSIPTQAQNWNQLAILRSSFGFPENISESEPIYSAQRGETYQTVIADSNVQAGFWYYYSLFVYIPADAVWVRAATTSALCLGAPQSGEMLWGLVPRVYRMMDNQFATATVPEGPLQRFLQLLGYELDWFQGYLGSLQNLNEGGLTPASLLPGLLSNLGVSYEAGLGTTRNRAIARNIIYINKLKGTNQSLTALASAYTGYGAFIGLGVNLLPNISDAGVIPASPGYGTGHWDLTNATLTTDPAAAGGTPTLTPEVGTASYILTATATGVMSMATATPDNDVTTWGVPLPVGNGGMYIFSGYVFTNATTAMTAQATITWTDHKGNSLYTTNGPSISITSTPTRFSVLDSPYPQSGVMPVYMAFTLTISTPNAGEQVWVNGLQVEKVSSTINMLTWADASIEETTYSWTPSNLTLAQVTTPVASGSYALGCTPTTPGPWSITSRSYSVTPGVAYTAAFEVDPATPSSTQTTSSYWVALNWYNQFGGLISTSEGIATTLTEGTYTQIFGTDVAPPEATSVTVTLAGVPTTGTSTTTVTQNGEQVTETVYSIVSAPFYVDDNELLQGTAPLVWAAPVPSAYDNPRDVKINLLPQRRNLITNPRFTNLTGWTMTGATALLQTDPTLPWVTPYIGTNIVEIESPTAAWSFTMNGIPVVREYPYSLTMWAQSIGSAQEVALQIQWFDFNGNLISTSASPSISVAAASESTTWVPVSVVVSAPTGAESATVGVTGPQTTTNVIVGAALFEQTSVPLPYFDAGCFPSTNYMWEGSANTSVSDMYLDQPLRVSRLEAVLEDYLPFQATYTLITGSAAVQAALVQQLNLTVPPLYPSTTLYPDTTLYPNA